jgi:uncharacterized protein YgiM (DUF1202 family)
VREATEKKFPITIVLVVIAVISTTVTFLVLINQKNLYQIINTQNTRIDDLNKSKDNLQFSKEVSNDSTITSIDELKKMIQDLSNKSSVLGASDINLGQTVPSTSIGIVTLNNGVSSVNIYSGPKTQSTILSTTAPDTLMFYYKKEAGWYQIELGIDKLGWVQSKFVTDLNQ